MKSRYQETYTSEAICLILFPGGATGDIILSDTNDRIANYYILHMNSSKKFDYVAETIAILNGTTLQRVRFLNLS